METFLDEVETEVLRDLAKCETEEELLETQAYYKAVLRFNEFLRERIGIAVAKERSLQELVQHEKGE